MDVTAAPGGCQRQRGGRGATPAESPELKGRARRGSGEGERSGARRDPCRLPTILGCGNRWAEPAPRPAELP